MSIPEEVRAHVFSNRSGSLATISVEPGLEGFPFGSVVPYALDERGRPLVFVSDLAEHTHNMAADPRVSLMVRPHAEGDPQSTWRVTLIGTMQKLEPNDETEHGYARYVAQVPNAPSYRSAHKFDLWRMDVARIRFIGGFGKIHWVEAVDYLREPGHAGYAESGCGMVDHMNEDHADAVMDYCKGLRDVQPASATMTGIDAGGFFVRTTEPDGLHYFPFEKEVAADDARMALIGMLKRARKSAQ